MYAIFQRIKLTRTGDQIKNFKGLGKNWSSLVHDASSMLCKIGYLGGLLVLDLCDSMKTRVKLVKSRLNNMGEDA